MHRFLRSEPAGAWRESGSDEPRGVGGQGATPFPQLPALALLAPPLAAPPRCPGAAAHRCRPALAQPKRPTRVAVCQLRGLPEVKGGVQVLVLQDDLQAAGGAEQERA